MPRQRALALGGAAHRVQEKLSAVLDLQSGLHKYGTFSVFAWSGFPWKFELCYRSFLRQLLQFWWF